MRMREGCILLINIKSDLLKILYNNFCPRKHYLDNIITSFSPYNNTQRVHIEHIKVVCKLQRGIVNNT